MGLNKIVDFSTAKLLKEKGFDEPCHDCYNLNGLLFSNGWCEYIADDHEFDGLVRLEKLKEKDVLAPTIAEVVMWLYEKHGIWVPINWQRGSKTFLYELIDVNSHENTLLIQEKNYKDVGEAEFNSPTEAYEAGIKYSLKKLI